MKQVVWLALLAACAEGETRLSELPPDGVQLRGCAAHPPAVIGESSVLELTVANLNDVDLLIEDIWFEGPFSAPSAPGAVTLPAGFATAVDVEFTPKAVGDKVGEVVFYLNAPPDTLRCSLSGEAWP